MSAAIPLRVQQIPAREVRVGSYLSYLEHPFEVTRIEPMEPHYTLGTRRIAYDRRGRSIILYDDLAATVVL